MIVGKHEEVRIRNALDQGLHGKIEIRRRRTADLLHQGRIGHVVAAPYMKSHGIAFGHSVRYFEIQPFRRPLEREVRSDLLLYRLEILLGLPESTQKSVGAR